MPCCKLTLEQKYDNAKKQIKQIIKKYGSSCIPLPFCFTTVCLWIWWDKKRFEILKINIIDEHRIYYLLDIFVVCKGLSSIL